MLKGRTASEQERQLPVQGQEQLRQAAAAAGWQQAASQRMRSMTCTDALGYVVRLAAAQTTPDRKAKGGPPTAAAPASPGCWIAVLKVVAARCSTQSGPGAAPRARGSRAWLQARRGLPVAQMS